MAEALSSELPNEQTESEVVLQPEAETEQPSARKTAANRRNSKKSTGPRTFAGKARVWLNGLKHGRYAMHF